MASKYDTHRFPPAPVLEIRLSAPQQPASPLIHSALLDTGSDFTLIPLSTLTEIDAPESRPAQVRGLWSDPHSVTLYFVDMHLENGILPAVEVIGTDMETPETEIILGRNVLNRLIMLLDGQELQTDILKRRPVRF